MRLMHHQCAEQQQTRSVRRLGGRPKKTKLINQTRRRMNVRDGRAPTTNAKHFDARFS